MITVAKSATDHYSTHKTIFIYKHYLWEIEFAHKNNWSRDFPWLLTEKSYITVTILAGRPVVDPQNHFYFVILLVLLLFFTQKVSICHPQLWVL